MNSTMPTQCRGGGPRRGSRGDCRKAKHSAPCARRFKDTPQIIMDPANVGYRINKTVGSQVDLLPTLCDRLGIPLPATELYLGRSLDAPRNGLDRLSYLNAFQQYGLVTGERMIFGDREREH